MADFTIELKGEQFKRRYLIYIIEIQHDTDRYYYIGQTGDKNYITARPAFRRLMGHFEDSGKSTQNQVYKYIVGDILGYKKEVSDEIFTDQIKLEAENFLSESKVTMHIYEVISFDPNVAKIQHHENVKKVVQLERYVIQSFIKSNKNVMNKDRTAPDDICPFSNILNTINSDFSIF